MKESKCRILICSLCLLLAFSASALGQQKSQKPQPEGPLTPAQAKARAAAAKQEQLNQELFGDIDTEAVGPALKAIAAGANVNARDRDGMTPLEHAALTGNAEMTRFLLGKGAVVNLTD